MNKDELDNKTKIKIVEKNIDLLNVQLKKITNDKLKSQYLEYLKAEEYNLSYLKMKYSEEML